MKAIRIILVACSLFMVGVPQNAAAQDAAKRAEIVRLLKVTNTTQILQRLVGTLLPQFASIAKKANPNIPDKVLNAINDEMMGLVNENAPQFIDSMVDIYARRFSLQEVRELADFYETPTGRKAIRLLPELMRDGQEAGQKWAEHIVPLLERRVREKLQESGYRWG